MSRSGGIFLSCVVELDLESPASVVALDLESPPPVAVLDLEPPPSVVTLGLKSPPPLAVLDLESPPSVVVLDLEWPPSVTVLDLESSPPSVAVLGLESPPSSGCCACRGSIVASCKQGASRLVQARRGGWMLEAEARVWGPDGAGPAAEACLSCHGSHE